MDYEAIARKWIEQVGAGFLLREYPGAVEATLTDTMPIVKGVLHAAGVPEMEKRLQAAETLCEAAKAISKYLCYPPYPPKCNECEPDTPSGECAWRPLFDTLREWEAVRE